MKNFRFEVITTTQAASGSIEAKSESEAKRKLTTMYTEKFTDSEGKKVQTEITKMTIQEEQ